VYNNEFYWSESKFRDNAHIFTPTSPMQDREEARWLQITPWVTAAALQNMHRICVILYTSVKVKLQ